MPVDNVIPFPQPHRRRRHDVPHVWIADDKRHIRSFVSALLDDLGCVVHAASDPVPTAGGPLVSADTVSIVLIGVSRDIAKPAALLQHLAAIGYTGKVLLMGGRHSLALHFAAGLGAGIGLPLLPVLGTPFRTADLERRISLARLPEPPQEAQTAKGGAISRLIRLGPSQAPSRPPRAP